MHLSCFHSFRFDSWVVLVVFRSCSSYGSLHQIVILCHAPCLALIIHVRNGPISKCVGVCEILVYLLSDFSIGNSYFITSLDLSHFDSSLLENTDDMYAFYCYILKSLYLTNFNSLLVESMTCMFCYCNQLKSFDLSNLIFL